MTRRGVVLGGGGMAGIAWETGYVAGLAEELFGSADANATGPLDVRRR